MHTASARDAPCEALLEKAIMPSSILRRFIPFALLLVVALPASGAPLGSSFTYQGDLQQSGSPVTGNYDFTFTLYNAVSGPAQVGTTQTVLNLAVTQGLFSSTLDFGISPFTGNAVWLEIAVRPAGSGSYTTLAPRQPITASPYALYALNAGTPGTSQWISDGHGNITYSGGAAGITGQSTHTATGVGVFFDGGNTGGASVYGYNYNTLQGITLYLNAPGGSVAVGSIPTPGAKLDVLANGGPAVQATTSGSTFFPANAAVRGIGNTGGGPSGTTCIGVYGSSSDDKGVWGTSSNNWGVAGNCLNAGTYGILGTPNEGVFGLTPNTTTPAGRFNAPTGGVAIEANGLARVKTLQILGGADLAERFEVEGAPEPGTVLGIDESRAGALRVCVEPYSRRVAGVVSGANDLAAGIKLGQGEAGHDDVAVALTGRVWVKCDAGEGAIHAGDLLTTASRAGYAMRARDRGRAQGAILGKAMTSLETGTGLVLVLVSLQ
jgi:hypothetical protein